MIHQGRVALHEDLLQVPEHINRDHERDVLSNALALASLKPGDTDDEFFEGYTPEQIAWVNKYSDDLSLYGFDLEEGCASTDDFRVGNQHG